MDDKSADAGPSPLRAKRKMRMRLLLGGLIALSVAHLIRSLDRAYWPSFLGADGAFARLLEPWMTEEYFLKNLDAKPVYDYAAMDATGGGIVTITLRKDEISSLTILRSDDDQTIQLEFELGHDGRRYHVAGSCTYYSHGRGCECGKHGPSGPPFHELYNFSLSVVTKH